MTDQIRIWGPGMTQISQPVEVVDRLASPFLDVEPLGQWLIGNQDQATKVMVTVDNDGTRTVKTIDHIDITTCQCGHPAVHITWNTMVSE